MSVLNQSTGLTQAEVLTDIGSKVDSMQTEEVIAMDNVQCFFKEMFQNISEGINFQTNSVTQEVSKSFDIIDDEDQPIDKLSENEEDLNFPPMISMQGKHAGSTKYIWAGYIYARDGYSQTFRCSERGRYRCLGRAVIKNGKVYETKQHSHPREPQILAIEQAKHRMLLRAQFDRSVKLRAIYLEACKTEPLVAARLDWKTMLNKMKKARSRKSVLSSKSCIEPVKRLNFDTEFTMVERYQSTDRKIQLEKIDGEAQSAPAIDQPRNNNHMPKISVNVYDAETGCTTTGLDISLHRLKNNVWCFIDRMKTDECGECISLNEHDFAIGLYKLNLDTRSYYSVRNQKCLYPYVEIVFDTQSTEELCHFSVQLSPFSYNVCSLPNSEILETRA